MNKVEWPFDKYRVINLKICNPSWKEETFHWVRSRGHSSVNDLVQALDLDTNDIGKDLAFKLVVAVEMAHVQQNAWINQRERCLEPGYVFRGWDPATGNIAFKFEMEPLPS